MRSLAAVLAVLTSLGAAAWAQTPPAPPNPEALSAVYACRAQTDAAARLACYDAAVGRLEQAQSSGEFAAVDAQSVRQLERESFGFSLPSLPRLSLPSLRRSADGASAAPQIEILELEIARVQESRAGRAAFVMTNGQVWRQIEPESTRLVRPGGKVTIRRAALGSFLMSVAAGGPAHRVRREQ